FETHCDRQAADRNAPQDEALKIIRERGYQRARGEGSAHREEDRPDGADLALAGLTVGSLAVGGPVGGLAVGGGGGWTAGGLRRRSDRGGLALGGRWRGLRRRRRTDRPALGIGLRPRQRTRSLFVDHDVAALDGLVVEALERIGPGLTGGLAAAARVERF